MWWWEGVACASRTVCGTCAYVGGNQDSFLGVAVMQVCGHQVLPGARSGANMWRLGYYLFTSCSRSNNHRAYLLLSSLFLRLTTDGVAYSLQQWHSDERSDANLGNQVAPAPRQWRKLLDGARLSNGCVPCGSHNGALQTAAAAHRFPLALQG